MSDLIRATATAFVEYSTLPAPANYGGVVEYVKKVASDGTVVMVRGDYVYYFRESHYNIGTMGRARLQDNINEHLRILRQVEKAVIE